MIDSKSEDTDAEDVGTNTRLWKAGIDLRCEGHNVFFAVEGITCRNHFEGSQNGYEKNNNIYYKKKADMWL